MEQGGWGGTWKEMLLVVMMERGADAGWALGRDACCCLPLLVDRWLWVSSCAGADADYVLVPMCVL